MCEGSGQSDGSVALASGGSQVDGVVALERRGALGRRVGVARRRVGAGKVLGQVALLGLLAGVAAIVVFAAAGPSLLVSRGGVPYEPGVPGGRGAVRGRARSRRSVRVAAGRGEPAVPGERIGGFHNDFFMLALSTAAIALLLSGRDRAAGAALAAAIRNLLGLAVGAGGAVPTVVHALDAAVVLVVIQRLLRNRDWLAGAGWSTLALVASIAWLMPGYVIWAFPLVALSGSRKLRSTTLALAAVILITFLPTTGMFLSADHLNPLGGRAVRHAIVQADRFQRP